MKEPKKIIDRLNELLTDELSSINQYIIQSEICRSWGYDHLHVELKKLASDEMKHAERLIERIIFLDGRPALSSIKINIGKEIEDQFTSDAEAESRAVNQYNNSIRLVEENSDSGTAEMLRAILADEEGHLDWLKSQSKQIEQLGVNVYLSEQMK